MLRRLLYAAVLLILLSGCAPGAETPATPSSVAQPSATPDSASQSEPTSQLCQADAERAGVSYTLTDPGASAELVWRADFVPWWVRSSADGRVLAVSDGGDSIYELTPEGGLEIAFRCPGVQIETFAAASDGALWFASRDGGRLYRVDADGAVAILADNGNRNLEAGPDGSVYAMEGGLTRIDADGTRTVINKNVGGRKFAVGPNGEVVFQRNGTVYLVTGPNEADREVLASGYGPEQWLAFGPDGKVYVTHWTGIDVIDLETGEVSSIDWLRNSNIGEAGAFAPDGRLLLYHPNTNVFAADLTNQTVSVYYQVISNSWAMAVNPGDAPYMAFGDKQADGQTNIFRVGDAGLELVATLPYGNERAMAFDDNGFGYLAVGDNSAGGGLYRFDPEDGSVEEYAEVQCWPSSIALNPQTGRIWWYDCGQLVSIDDTGQQVTIPGPANAEQLTFAITSAGDFYAIAFYHRNDQSDVSPHSLLRLDAEGQTWSEVADLTQTDPGITLSTLAACPDGNIYTVESLDGNQLQIPRSSFNAVRRLEQDDSLSLLGYDFAFDGLAADCDSETNVIYFTSGAGLFALTPPSP